MKNENTFCVSRRDFLISTAAGTVMASGILGVPVFAKEKEAFDLPALPYPHQALEPHISERTLKFHYGKHHQGYVDKLNKLVSGTPYAGYSLQKIIKETAGKDDKKDIYNNAAQVWNHDFYWNCMTPKGGGGQPKGVLEERIKADLGSFENFKNAFMTTAESRFGSGYGWLVEDGGKLKVINTLNAHNPMAEGMTPLLTIDVWEHAYYLDYQNRRKDYIDAFMNHLVNWEFVLKNLKREKP